tara:strand:+ start:287 stop:400 length:114 start_codon:yes stop_codon:yes gene_type:complete
MSKIKVKKVKYNRLPSTKDDSLGARYYNIIKEKIKNE